MKMKKIILAFIVLLSFQTSVFAGEKNDINKIAYKLSGYCKQYDGFFLNHIPVFDGEKWTCTGPHGMSYDIPDEIVNNTCQLILEKRDKNIYFHLQIQKCVDNWMAR